MKPREDPTSSLSSSESGSVGEESERGDLRAGGWIAAKAG